MKIPYIKSPAIEEITVSAFRGVDRRPGAGADSFADMENMTGAMSPAATPRKKRGKVNFGGATIYNMVSLDIMQNGSVIPNAFIVDTGTRLRAYYSDNGSFTGHHIMNVSNFFAPGKKQTVISGTRLFFFPDNVYINLMDTDDKAALDFSQSRTLGNDGQFFYELNLVPCDLDATPNTSGSYGRLSCKCYNLKSDGTQGTFREEVAFNAALKQYDTVEIKGFSDKSLDGYYNICAIDMARHYLIIRCPASDVSRAGIYTIRRRVPLMDYVVACKNRLWGCRYGTDADGKSVNEIYCSSLGDPSNWYRYEGVSTDSWTASISSGGAFTGAVCFGASPVFFKENAVIKVFGDYPAEFSVIETPIRGIEKGSSESAVVVNDALYYKSYNGIVKYDGALPKRIDAALGEHSFKNAVAGAVDSRYFVSMEEDGRRRLFVYDTEKKVWHIEDDPGIESFCRCGGELYMLCQSGSESNVYSVGGTFNTDSESMGGSEDRVRWMCESVNLGFETPEHKYVSRVTMRLLLDADAEAEVSISYDGDGRWHTQKVLHGGGDGSVAVSIRPRRCSYFKLRLCGSGGAKLYSVSQRLEGCSVHS